MCISNQSYLTSPLGTSPFHDGLSSFFFTHANLFHLYNMSTTNSFCSFLSLFFRGPQRLDPIQSSQQFFFKCTPRNTKTRYLHVCNKIAPGGKPIVGLQVVRMERVTDETDCTNQVLFHAHVLTKVAQTHSQVSVSVSAGGS